LNRKKIEELKAVKEIIINTRRMLAEANAPIYNDASGESHSLRNNCANSYTNIIRNDDSRVDQIDERETIRDSSLLEDSDERRVSLNANIYRYKFTQEVMDELHKFSKIHQYDDRKSFKDAWNNWLEENGDLVRDEMERLTNLNYEGDILDKMFKSARYYFKKKGTSKPEPKSRRQYLSVQKDLLDAMDEHILKKKSDPDYKPSDGFSDFCNTHLDLLKEEVVRLVVEHNVNDVNVIKDKIKKTYKNRYFILRERGSKPVEITN
jgi:hypothetical protein